MRILVCGGRDFTGYLQLHKVLLGYFEEYDDIVIIQGGASGADFLAKVFAEENGLKVEEFKADWKGLGRSAGVIRNQRMIDEGKPDVVIAMPGGRGTTDMVARADASGIPVMDFRK